MLQNENERQYITCEVHSSYLDRQGHHIVLKKFRWEKDHQWPVSQDDVQLNEVSTGSKQHRIMSYNQDREINQDKTRKGFTSINFAIRVVCS